MKKNEKDELLEKVLGKDSKRRIFSVNESKEFVYDSSIKKELNDSTELLNSMLQKQTEEVKSLINESDLSDIDFERLREEIKKDFGVTLNKDATLEKSKPSKLYMSNEDYESIIDNVNKVCIGQTDMVNKLTMAFRKPFVSEKDNSKPLFSVCICGDPGTGKHLAVKTLLQECADKGFLSGYQYVSIKLDNYLTLEDEKNFVQDVYMALQTDSSVIVFENVDKCEAVFVPMLEELVSKYRLSLKKRYILKDKQLVETNSTLVTSAIDHLSFAKKGIVMIADTSRAKLTNKLGKEFFESFDSIIESKTFDNGDLRIIIEGLLEKLTKKCLSLNFEIKYNPVFDS